MKRAHLALMLSSVLFSFAAIAEQSLIKPQTQGEVTFVSGGVGGDEQKALQGLRADYNLSLLFSVKGSTSLPLIETARESIKRQRSEANR